MNPAPPDLVICALCGAETKPRGFDHALQGPVGTCCFGDLANASHALVEAGFSLVTHNPAHEK